VGSGECVEGNKSQRKKRIVSAVHTWYAQNRTIVPHNRDIEEHGPTNSYRVRNQYELHRAQASKQIAHNKKKTESEEQNRLCTLASEGRQGTLRVVSRGREGDGGRLRVIHVILLVTVFSIAG